jgi:hypothetical protein
MFAPRWIVRSGLKEVGLDALDTPPGLQHTRFDTQWGHRNATKHFDRDLGQPHRDRRRKSV